MSGYLLSWGWCGRSRCGEEDQRFILDIISEIPIKYSSRDVEEAEEYTRLEFRAKVWLGNIHGKHHGI